MQIGTNRDFDPEVYRKQIREYQVSRVEGPRRAYVGAGDILCHSETDAAPSVAPASSHASLAHSGNYTGSGILEQADVVDTCNEFPAAAAQ